MEDRLEEILQAAREIETSTTASLEACGFANEEERLSYINSQAEEIARLTEILLGYGKG